MADFGELLGTILVGVAHARRMADEETAAIAEHYKEHPLLEGMAVPRIRLPEIELDLPILIESQDASDKSDMADPEDVEKQLMDQLDKTKGEAKVQLPVGFEKKFQVNLSRTLKLSQQKNTWFKFRRGSTEGVVRATNTALNKTIASFSVDFKKMVSPDDATLLREDLTNRAQTAAVKKIGKTPFINASIETSNVKEKSNPHSVARMKLTIKEEGVEWNVEDSGNGEVKRNLIPE